MAVEIETKLRVDAHEPVRNTLQSLHARCLGAVLETNVILDSADRSLRHRGCGLRVRTSKSDSTSESTTTLTFKGPVSPGSVKRREEREVAVGDLVEMLSVLEALGYVPILQYRKRRESWVLDACRIELDEPPHIGLFVEIEGPTEDDVHKMQRRLRLEKSAHVRASYVRLLMEYCSEQGLTDPVLDLSNSTRSPSQ